MSAEGWNELGWFLAAFVWGLYFRPFFDAVGHTLVNAWRNWKDKES